MNRMAQINNRMASEIQQFNLFEKDSVKAINAIDKAQFIAFSPYIWETTRLLDKYQILLQVQAAKQGITIAEIAAQNTLSHYGIRILLEAGLGIGLVYRKEDKFFLAKTGYMLLNHQMSKVNFEFMRDVCAAGAADLEAAILNEKPEGLKHLGDWNTLYEGLSVFPEPAKTSWLNFDHFYSDNAFPEALPIVFSKMPKSILDIGGNTGKWTLQCLNYNSEVQMGIVDLPGQINMATQNINAAGFEGRVNYHPQNILHETNELPTGYDVIWMSQFLDCFADQEIVNILKKCHEVADENTTIYINETFWDRQRFETSAFTLQMTSLYFTTMANGNSQMYDSKVFFKLIEAAGFKIERVYDLVGLSHTILELKKA